MTIDLIEAKKFAEQIAKRAGQFLLENQKKAKVKRYKDRQDIVTNIDLQVEKIIISAIEEKYPGHNILSEEKGPIDKKSDYTWHIDPLDGTKEYLRQIPAYNTSFCLFYKKEPILGVVYIPYSTQLFYATSKSGAFLNGKKIKVNNQKSLENSVIYVHPPAFGKVENSYFEKVFVMYRNLARKVYKLRFSSNDNTFLSFLALGSIEAYLHFSWSTKAVSDVVPGLFIAKMAGAKITDLRGRRLDFSRAGQFYIASNSKIHEQLIKLIKS